MTQYFVDTNIFLRLLLKDDQEMHQKAELLFEKAEKGKFKLWTTDVVILEIVWTLKALYDYPKENIKIAVSGLFGIENLKIQNRPLLISALNDHVTYNVDFADAYNYQFAQKEGFKILSFDKHFDRIGKRENIERLIK